jgi:hypothetical protein
MKAEESLSTEHFKLSTISSDTLAISLKPISAGSETMILSIENLTAKNRKERPVNRSS